MTRFMQELNGTLGEFWKQRAEKELETVRADLDAGKITIDEKGIARNCIGRVLMSDMLEKLAMVTDRVDTGATTAAREAEVAKELESYRANKKPHSAEEIAEMRVVFGVGTTVVDILTGEKTVL